jgi:hypothetical protein
MGLSVTTFDFDPSIGPNFVRDVTRLPFKSGAFHCILAAEVLEHLPFDEFVGTLAELKRVCSASVIVTLPTPLVGPSALINVPAWNPMAISIGRPYAVRHRFDGQHYREVGKAGHGMRRVKRCIREIGLRIVRSFRLAPSLFYYFFVCDVGSGERNP